MDGHQYANSFVVGNRQYHPGIVCSAIFLAHYHFGHGAREAVVYILPFEQLLPGILQVLRLCAVK